MTELRFVISDPELCTGCMICSNVCSMHYFKVISPARARNRVFRTEDGLDFSLFCRNCEDAPCIDACPNEAISRTSKGLVVIKAKLCDGTGACVQACPYNSITINPDTGKAIKCIQCDQCVKRCPADAIWTTTQTELDQKDPEGRILSQHDKHTEYLYGKEARM